MSNERRRQKLIRRFQTIAGPNTNRADIEDLVDEILAEQGGRSSEESRRQRSTGRGVRTADFRNMLPDIRETGEEALESLLGNIGQVEGAAKSLTLEIKNNRFESEEFFRAGFDKRYFDMSEAISKAADTSMRLTGNLRAQEDAIGGLRRGFGQFALASKEMKNTVADMATGLAAAGVDIDTYASIVESSTMGFGQSTGQLEDMTAALMATSREFSIAPKQMIDDFNEFQKEFAYSADKTMDVFVKLQKMSRTTGVSFRSLTTAFGDSMDRFDSVASKAGQLNQILGKSMFNSIDLLNKSEEERAETIRKGIQSRFGTNVNNIQKFEMKALSQTLGMSIDDTRRFLSGKPTELKAKLDEMDRKGDPVKIQAQSLSDEMEQLDLAMRAYRRSTENTMIDFNNSFREGFKSIKRFSGGLDKFAQDFGNKLLADVGLAKTRGSKTETSDMFQRLLNSIESQGKRAGLVASKEGMPEVVKDAYESLTEGFKTFIDDTVNKYGPAPVLEAIQAANTGTKSSKGSPKKVSQKTNSTVASNPARGSEMLLNAASAMFNAGKVYIGSLVVDGKDRGSATGDIKPSSQANPAN